MLYAGDNLKKKIIEVGFNFYFVSLWAVWIWWQGVIPLFSNLYVFYMCYIVNPIISLADLNCSDSSALHLDYNPNFYDGQKA